MAVTISKAKKKTKVASVTSGKMAQLVDQMGDIGVKIDKVNEKLAPLNKQFAKAQTELLEIVDDLLSDDQTQTIEGKVWEMTVGMKGNTTEVTENESVFKILNKIEPGLAWVLMRFGITDLRKYLTPKQFEAVSLTTRSRKRTLKMEKL